MFRKLKISALLLAILFTLIAPFQTRAENAPRIFFTSDRESGYGLFTVHVDGKNLVQIADDTVDQRLAPAWSPDGKQIAYVSRRDGQPTVYVMDTDGKNAHPLSSTKSQRIGSLIWSSKNRIAFNSFHDSSGLFSVNPDGSDFKQVSTEVMFDYAWSPNGSKIAYEGDANAIFVMDADGTNRKQVSKDKAYYDSVDWTPGGKSILVHSFGNGRQGIFTLDVQTGAAHQITSQSDGNSLRESPDGKYLAYTMGDFTTGGIYIANAKGQSRKQLTTVYEQAFAWSPDSLHIAFPSIRSRTVKIYSMASDGTDVKSVGNITGDEFSISPDGKQIVYIHAQDATSKAQIAVMDIDGGNQVQLTNDPKTYYSQPIWTPDGKHIIYAFFGSSLGLNIMDPDGKNQKRLFSFGASDAVGSAPVISPDGTQIAYAGGSTYPADIYIASIAGKSPHRLTTGGGQKPHWSPDGKHISFIAGQQQRPEVIDINGKNLRQLDDINSTDTAWSPDGKYVAFMSYKGVETVDITDSGSAANVITSSQSDYFAASDLVWVAPDELLFASTHEGNFDIYSVKPDGSGLKNLTQNPGDDQRIAIAPQ